ncbi:hypothetical protein ACIQU6_41680 [Streptomyces sp. NPDC090442]|uniref:hypothetical protein n=1 Tax=Streptomyces sp. NPDC090442 TaxID=3365962 RepID=UPI00381068DC
MRVSRGQFAAQVLSLRLRQGSAVLRLRQGLPELALLIGVTSPRAHPAHLALLTGRRIRRRRGIEPQPGAQQILYRDQPAAALVAL